MRLPVTSAAHKGKLLEVDPERETITLIGPEGEVLGRTTWNSLIDQLQASGAPPASAPVRQHPRVALSIPVRYRIADGPVVQSRTSGIGGGGLFIECPSPPPVGTTLSVEFTLPDRPDDWVPAACAVAWICARPDQYQFQQGMGVKFLEISLEVFERVVTLVNSLREKRP
jgi:type IV pilus assembly protein PilZ